MSVCQPHTRSISGGHGGGFPANSCACISVGVCLLLRLLGRGLVSSVHMPVGAPGGCHHFPPDPGVGRPIVPQPGPRVAFPVI